MKALSVRQPWAWLLFHGKPVENRSWRLNYRGPLAIHAACGMTAKEYAEARDFVAYSVGLDMARLIPGPAELVRGAILGTVLMTDCVMRHHSPFFVGDYGYVFTQQRQLPVPVPCKGGLGLWEVPEEIAEEVRRQLEDVGLPRLSES